MPARQNSASAPPNNTAHAENSCGSGSRFQKITADAENSRET
jgi:hypothetical protein